MNMIEVPANDQRDIHVVTTEIRQLVNQYRRITVAFAVEIGRRLVEAKALLPHGEWGDWLREQVDFSQRTANNFMRVFEEYGDQQITLFGAVPNSHAIANLSITKALQLLSLPEDERETFAETNDVKAMSTRELNEAIRAKLDAERERDAAEEKLKTLEEEKRDLVKKLSQADPQAVEEARSNAEAHKKLLQDAQKRVDELTVALEKARDLAIKKAAEAKQLKENPEISEDAAEKLRAEGAAAEAEKAKAELEKAKAAAEKAKQKAKAAAERAETLEKQLRTAAPELAAFKSQFQQVQADLDRLQAAFRDVQSTQPEAAEKLKAALAALADKLKGW